MSDPARSKGLTGEGGCAGAEGSRKALGYQRVDCGSGSGFATPQRKDYWKRVAARRRKEGREGKAIGAQLAFRIQAVSRVCT